MSASARSASALRHAQGRSRGEGGSRRRHVFAVVSLLLLAACGNSRPPAPSPGGGTGETITGRERIGWDQPASSAAELAAFRYAIYVDGARTELAGVACANTAGPGGFACSGQLPAMSNGSHTLELASFVAPDGPESTRSSPLRVTVTGIAAPSAPIASGDVITTADGVRLGADVLLDGLDRPTALAISADGRTFIGTEAGLMIAAVGQAFRSEASAAIGHVLSIVLSPSFDRDGHIYITEALPPGERPARFLTSRYHVTDAGLVERMVLLENGPASSNATAALRIGADGKLYAAFDDGGNAGAAERISEWSGKVLRMELDGRTPSDQAAASPVLFRGLTSPRGLDWPLDGSTMWVADASRDGVERLRVVETTSERPRRAAQRGTFTMPRGLGASAMAFYRGDAIKEFAGQLLVAARDGGYILRVVFDPVDRNRPIATERLLEDRVSTVRALAVGPDGAIYFCTESVLIRLTRAG